MVETVHSKRSEAIKIGCGCNLKRRLPLKTDMTLVAKAIKYEKNTSHGGNVDSEKCLKVVRRKSSIYHSSNPQL